MAWGLAGLFFTVVALPLTSSSLYPTPSHQTWAVAPAPATFALASASSASSAPPAMMLASASSVPVTLTPQRPAPPPADDSQPDKPEITGSLVTMVRTVSIRRPIGEDPASAPDNRDASAAEDRTASPRLPMAAPSLPDDAVDAETTARPARAGSAQARDRMREVDAYLWAVYQRAPTKRDRSGDFTWKDPAAAKRLGMTLQGYVIQGMDPDLREIMYHAGKAMDAAGIEWTIASGFRDDYRQSIATGIKARTGYSRHGGSRATGGHGHGRAIDVGHADGHNNMMVFRWIDMNGARYGISRPLRHFDPPHVEPRHDWRRIAAHLRSERTGAAAVAGNGARTDGTPVRAASIGSARPRDRTQRARRYN